MDMVRTTKAEFKTLPVGSYLVLISKGCKNDRQELQVANVFYMGSGSDRKKAFQCDGRYDFDIEEIYAYHPLPDVEQINFVEKLDV